MENPPESRTSFAPSPALAWLCAAGAALAALLAVVDGDPAGRLIVGIAAVVLAGIAVVDLAWIPRLVITSTGVTVRTMSGARQLAWTDIEDIRVDEHSRLGLASRTLEIDTGRSLLILGRHSLGTDPREALPLVLAFRPSDH